MRLITLVENTTISSKYKPKHGMCFYIETKSHKILFDLGQDGLFLENARKMGINIADVDIVIISHGHIDHAGALKLFLENNKTAKIYVCETAFDKHLTKVLGFHVNIGIDSSLKHHPQIILTQKRTKIDDQLLLFSDVESREFYSTSNESLFVEKDGVKSLDNFSHEQNLIIFESQNKILIAGCSHAGIVNIKEKAEGIINGKLDYIISGFHLYNPVSKKTESNTLVHQIAEQLNDSYTFYYTCHCTGKKAFASLKEVLRDKISYLSTGSILKL